MTGNQEYICVVLHQLEPLSPHTVTPYIPAVKLDIQITSILAWFTLMTLSSRHTHHSMAGKLTIRIIEFASFQTAIMLCGSVEHRAHPLRAGELALLEHANLEIAHDRENAAPTSNMNELHSCITRLQHASICQLSRTFIISLHLIDLHFLCQVLWEFCTVSCIHQRACALDVCVYVGCVCS